SLAPPGSLSPLEVFENLALAASLDGKLDPAERELLEAKAGALGLDQATVRDAIARVARRELSAFHVPTSEAARKRVLADVLRVLRADGALAVPEQRALNTLVRELQLSEADVQRAFRGS
ncbi:MAG: hypothetical protein KDD82_15465, partial [Planctomycetes bacterium]|nr:hypothetical protein [Planctomycetota bacterium]